MCRELRGKAPLYGELIVYKVANRFEFKLKEQTNYSFRRRISYEFSTLQEEKSSAKNAALQELIANLTPLLANEDAWEQNKNKVRNIIR